MQSGPMRPVRAGRRSSFLARLMAAVLTATGSMAVASVTAVPTPVSAAPPASTVSEFQPTTPTKFGGRSISVSVNASDPNDVVVATESGGLFLSGDDGANWSHVDSSPLHRMSDVKWSPNNPSLIVATTWASNDTQNGGGVWRSTNAGATWSRTSTPAGCGLDFNGWGNRLRAVEQRCLCRQ